MKLKLTFDGSASSITPLANAVTAAGSNTSIIVTSANAMRPTDVEALMRIAGSKNLSIQMQGDSISPSQLERTFNSPSGPNTSFVIASANALRITDLIAAIQATGNRFLSITFDGKASSEGFINQVIAAGGPHASFIINSAHALQIDTLIKIIRSSQNKKLSLTLNGAQLSSNSDGNQILRIIEAAGPHTHINLNTAHATPIELLLSTIRAAANKNFSAEFNGAQLSTTPLTGNHLLRAVETAGKNTSISINTAQAVNIDTLLDIMLRASNKKSPCRIQWCSTHHHTHYW